MKARWNNKLVNVPAVALPSASWNNLVVYNGYEKEKVVRSSTLFGTQFFEFTPNEEGFKYASWKYEGHVRSFKDFPPLMNPPEIRRILPNVIPLGRLALMDRKILSHNAYDTVTAEIKIHDIAG
jgi:hypothetical protein